MKFNRSVDAINILSKQSLYPSGTTIKPDLPPEKRDIDKILLSERWNLIQSGVQRTQIKIRGSSLFVSGKLYGRVTNMQFIKSPAMSQTSTESDNDLPRSSVTEESST